MKSKCKYSEGDGKIIIGEHVFSKDGFCCICGEPEPKLEPKLKHTCPVCGLDMDIDSIGVWFCWGNHE